MFTIFGKTINFKLAYFCSFRIMFYLLDTNSDININLNFFKGD